MWVVCRVGDLLELLKNGSQNVKIASAVKVTLALCVCCLPVPKNSWFLCPSLPFSFTLLSLALVFIFLSAAALFSSCSFFLFPTPFFLLYPSLSPPHYLSLPHFSFLIILIFLPVCNCIPFHPFLLNPLISSLPIPSSVPFQPDCLSSLLLLFFVSLSLLDLEHPLSYLSQTSLCISCFLSPPLISFLSYSLSVLSLISSRMSEFSEEPRFTIEQIDLLQRLRRSGMTKQEILHALDTLDRLDREHGDKFGRRTSSSSSSSSSYGVGGTNNCTNNSASNTTTSFNNNNTASATTTSAVTCNGNNSAINSGEANIGDHSATAASSTTSKISTATQTQFGNSGGLSPSLSNTYDTSPPPGPPPPSAILPSPVSLVALSQNGRDSLAATPNGKLSPPRYPVNSAAAARAFGFEAAEEDLDVDDKVEELMRSVLKRTDFIS